MKGVGVAQKPLLFWEKKRVWKLCQNTLPLFSKKEEKNSKVFEQKGDLLNFKANIDPMTVLSRVKPGCAKLSWVKLSQEELEQAEPSWAKQSPEPT